ncbi:hypothetical protein CROQUDRAFT_87391 [Cronartium quercuum f. sp. fusiforme G11]|uniref:Uncharacterized protein n=1 Tax=Cronartium quercuum f. sp. fusiforme G11 TaxID=708437 RepID=A0A9P6NVG9_9BASI|nr:hypothetical protein CROQUDRAFT_87391 [Cronartium quercuum f. sp. fusiforme G11]
MPTTRQVLTIGGISVLTAGISYCFYFDYKRRNDPAFRKKLLKEQRRLSKQKQTSSKNASRDAEKMLEAAVAAVNAEPLPKTNEGKENYFMEQVGMGEMLAGRLPQGTVPAAISFFKAYKVYPSPQELMMIYQRTMPTEVFALVVEMIKLDVNQTMRSSASSSHRGAPSGGAVIEEITGDERAALDAASKLASKAASSSPAKPSSKVESTQPDSVNSKTSEDNEKLGLSGANQSKGYETSSPTLAVPTSDAPISQSDAEQPLPRSESPKSAPSEQGSGVGDSQNANSFVLVEDAPTGEPVPPVDQIPLVTEEDGWVDDHDEKPVLAPEVDSKNEEPTPVPKVAVVSESVVVETVAEETEVAAA